MNVVLDQPSVAEVLLLLQEATGLKFTVDEALARHDPSFGSVQMRAAPAWVVMNFVAKTDLVEGRWDKTEDGYRLVATKSLREKAPPPGRIPNWLTGVGVLLLVLACYAIWRYSHFKQEGKQAAGK